MREAHRGIGSVDVLATGPRGTKSVDPQICSADRYIADFVGFGHDGHRARRSMNPALSFCFWYPLYPVGTGLELQPRVSPSTDNPADYLLKAAMLARTLTHDFDFPSLFFGKAAVHTEKVSSKQSGFVTACTGSDFKKNVPLVVGVFGDQKLLQLALKCIKLYLQSRQFLLGHFPDREVIVVDHNLGLVEFLRQLLVFLKLSYHRGDIRKFNGQVAE